MKKEKLKPDPKTGKPLRDPRIKKRNEISALESRVQKRINDLENENELGNMKQNSNKLVMALCETIKGPQRDEFFQRLGVEIHKN